MIPLKPYLLALPGIASLMFSGSVLFPREESIEKKASKIHAKVLTVDTHVEPLEDPRSFADEELDRRGVPPSARPMGPEADKLR